jgi:hypothetical protein
MLFELTAVELINDLLRIDLEWMLIIAQVFHRCNDGRRMEAAALVVLEPLLDRRGVFVRALNSK